MAYVKTTWATGDIVTADKLNNIETGIEHVDNAVGTLGENLGSLSEDVETIGGDLDSLAEDVQSQKTQTDSELEILSQIADGTYQGRDLTQVHAEEIGSSNPWSWIKSRITRGKYSGIHVGDYIPYTDNTTSKVTRNAIIMGIDTYAWYGSTSLFHHIDFWGGLWSTAKGINRGRYNNGTTQSPFPWIASDAYLYANSMSGQIPSQATADPTLVAVNYTSDGILYNLPTQLKNVITQKRLYLEQRYTAGSLLTDSTTYQSTQIGKIWFPTEYEMFGTSIYSDPRWGNGGMVQYPLFAKKFNFGMLGKKNFQLLNPGAGNSSGWCRVNTVGLPTEFNADSVSSVYYPICFRIQ